MIGAILFLPLLLNSVLAFTDWSTFRSQIQWVSLRNFEAMARLNQILRPLGLTLAYAATVAIVQNLVALGLALLLERPTRANQLYRTLFFIPVLISPLAAGYVARGLLDPSGPLNEGLSLITSQDVSVAWLGIPDTAIFTVALIDAWKWLGFAMIVYLAGLASISRDLIDSAIVDGASQWQTFRLVKLPLLGPALTFNIVLTLIGSMNAFDIILSTTKGGPGDASTVLNIVMWRNFSTGLFANATAMSLMIMVLVLASSIPLIKFLRGREVQA
jgi:ABC-type sugar transport system permease subunit